MDTDKPTTDFYSTAMIIACWSWTIGNKLLTILQKCFSRHCPFKNNVSNQK